MSSWDMWLLAGVSREMLERALGSRDNAGITDEGQISRLLARLQGLGLIENSGQGQVKGMPNAWSLTEEGSKVDRVA